MKQKIIWIIIISAILVILESFAWTSVLNNCKAQGNCPVDAVNGNNPLPENLAIDYFVVGTDRLSNDGPTFTKIWKGYPPAAAKLVPPYVPCILLKAMAYQESGWRQFDAGWGQDGPTLISPDCGYGVMQITSGMSGGEGFDPSLVASSPTYNIGTGAKMLIEKWNWVQKYIGNNDPTVVEDWYYAVWAYNGWGEDNNPNHICQQGDPPNHKCYDPNRAPFVGSENQDPNDWPYQEVIWGYAANPPLSLWQPMALTLPPTASITYPNPPTHINRPSPAHTSCNKAILPLIIMQCDPDTFEPNDSFSTAYGISLSLWYKSSIWTISDNDWYKFYITASSTNPKYINISLQRIPANTNYNLQLYNPSGQLKAQSINSGSADESISYRVTQNGWYRARVYSAYGYHKCGKYIIKVW